MKNYIVLCVLGGLLVACGSEPKKETDSEPKTIVKEVVVVKEVERPSVAPAPTSTTSTPTPQPTQTATLPPSEEPKKRKELLKEQKGELDKLKRDFDDQFRSSLATPRLYFTPERMQSIKSARNAYVDYKHDKCFDVPKQKLVAHMDKLMDLLGFWISDTQAEDKTVDTAINNYTYNFRDYEHMMNQCIQFAHD